MTKAAIEAVQAKGERTRQNILDAAELLFGENDYDSISLRDVAQESNVLLGAVSYHFKNKASLFEAVVTRRAEEMNGFLLDELEKHPNPTLEQVIDAFVSPVLARSELPGWSSYVRITAQLYYQDRWWDMQRRLFRRHGEAFAAALAPTLPDASPDVIQQILTYAITVTLSTAVLKSSKSEGRAPNLPESVVPFLCGGARALAAQMAASGKRKKSTSC